MSETVHVGSGKVRELYALDDERLLLTASDRISVFDVVLPTEIPDKGRVLTGLSGFWFDAHERIVPNHLLEIREDGRSMECRRLLMLPIECVVRGYLSGLGLEELPGERRGLRDRAARGPPRVGPASGADLHADDEGRRGSRRAADARAGGRPRRRRAVRRARADLDRPLRRRPPTPPEKGIIIADTKFELGLDEQGSVVLGDEAFTPDSSRFWPADEYEPGGPQPSFDKQFVRDYAESLGWDKTPPGPELPDAVVTGTRARYLDAFEQITRHPVRRLRREAGVVLA